MGPHRLQLAPNVRGLAFAFAFAFALGSSGVATAQPVDQNLWVTNGQVNAMVHHGGMIYLGGNFTHVGPPTGGGAAIDASGNLMPVLSRVDGAVFAVAPDGSGGWYVGGFFNMVGGVARANLVRVTANGSVAPWNPVANNTVRAIAVSGGIVYVGGDFTFAGGLARNRVAALDATTGAATTWNPGVANGSVTCLAVDGTTVYAGGSFTSVGGAVRNRIAAISSTGSVTPWNPSSDGTVNALVAGAAGVVFAGGAFANIGGQPRANLAALDPSSGAATGWNPGSNSSVSALALGISTLYVGGDFTNVGGQGRNRVAGLDPATGVPSAWNPNANSVVSAIAVSGTTVYAGGGFTSIGGQTRNYAAALSNASGAALAWNPNANSPLYALAVSGGAIYAGGPFTSICGQTRNRIASIDATTGAVTGWNPNASSTVYALAVRGATIYAAGDFLAIGGQSRSRIAAVDSSTGAASAWNPNANNPAYALAVSGNIVYAGGTFTSIGGMIRGMIAALDLSGAATAWNPNANARVYALAVGGGKVYAGGWFGSIGGQPRNRIAALDATSGVATAWNPNADGSGVNALALEGRKLYVGGDFNTIGGAARNRIAALDTASGAATAWNPNANSLVSALAPNGGIVYAGGGFTTIGGQTRNRVAALDSSTGSALAWNPDANNTVNTLALRDAFVYVGGLFNRISGQARSGLAGFGGPPVVAGIAPASGGNSGITTATVSGQNLGQNLRAGPPTIILRIPGTMESIPGTGVVAAADRRSLTASFDLSGATPGPRDVVVTNPDLQTATLSSGFTVEALAAPQLRVDVIGPDRVRTGYPTAFDLVLENPGNVDARSVPLWIAGIPAAATVTLDFPLTPVPQDAGEPDWSQLPGDLTSPGGRYLALVIPRVPPGTFTRRLYLTLPSPTSFQLTAALTPPWAGGTQFRACLAAGGVIPDTPCLGAQLGAIDAYLVAHPEAQALNGIGVWAKIGWQCEGAGSLAAALAEAQQALGFMLQPVEQTGSLPPGCSAVLAPSWRELLAIQVGGSIDPNDKFGNRGAGSAITSQQILSYSVRFENLGAALFPAQQVVVSDAIDPDLDVNTLSLGTIAFGKDPNGIPYHLFPPPGQSSYAASLDLRPAHNLIVNVSVLFTGSTLNWYFTSVDPAGQPLPPNAGFLPPNLNPPEGEGSVVFTVRPRNGLAPGTQITNAASLTFDNNPPMTTPMWANSVDDSPPASHVLPIGSPQAVPFLNVSWTADGPPADVRDYTVCVSEDGGPYRSWRLNTTATADTFMVRNDHHPHTYAFYSVARDQIGNMETPPLNPDAQTTSVLAVDDAGGPTLALAGARPNPALGSMRVWFTLAGREQAAIDVMDIAGRRVLRREVGSLGPGPHLVTLDASPGLRSGLYFLRLVQGEHVRHARVVLVR